MTEHAAVERFDPAALDTLRRLGDGSVLGRMIDLFLKSIPARIEAARQGLRNNDIGAVESAAHSIKSSAGQLGGARLRRTAAEVERDAGKGNLHTLAAGVEAIHSEFELMRAWLTRVAGRPDTPPS